MQIGVDTNQIPDSEFTPLPDGQYVGRIEKIESESTTDNNGEQLKLTIDVITAGYEGRKVFDRICYMHSTNQQRKDIGLQTWKALCASQNLSGNVDTNQLINGMVHFKLVTKGEYQNVKNYKSATANQGVVPGQVQNQPMFNNGQQTAPAQSPVAGYAQTQPQAVPQSGGIQSDDIPF